MPSFKSLSGLIAAASAVVFTQCFPANASTTHVIHSFCSAGGSSCTDGINPRDIIIDGSGNVYGTAHGGGANNAGVVYEMTPNADKTKWTYSVIYNFCQHNSCADGIAPVGPLIIDTSGNLYGVTDWEGSAGGWGILYELSPSGSGQWTQTVLYQFCAVNNCTDGGTPIGGLTYAGAASGVPYDGTSPLYSETTDFARYGNGAVVEIDPPSGKKKLWSARPLYAFCAKMDCPAGNPGSVIDGPMALDSNGNLYGTTSGGGKTGDGVLFELSPGAKWTQTTLYNFCTQKGTGGNNCVDGGQPVANPILDAEGALLGTASIGGLYTSGSMFKFTLNGARTQYTKLYDFCSDTGCSDGGTPAGYLLLDAAGKIYGTTTSGGVGYRGGEGVVFEYQPSGTYSVLNRFCRKSGCTDGDGPEGSLVLDSSGKLLGTTTYGGAKGQGTAFVLTH